MTAAKNDEKNGRTGHPDGLTVLVIEDEESVRKMVQQLLQRRGYRVIAAATGPDALVIFQTQHQSIHVILTDLRLGRMQGEEIIHQLRVLDPMVRIVAYSGAVGNAQSIFEETGRLAYVQKPMSSQELVDAIEKVMNAPH